METKSARGKQTANRSKLPIIIAALVVVLLLLVLGALLLFGGSEPQPTPTEPTTSTQDPSKPSETTPPPVNVPVKVWDMEALPENLIDAGMAYANSSNTIYGNLRIGAGKGTPRPRLTGAQTRALLWTSSGSPLLARCPT